MLRYRFGSNELYIGNAILKVLELLEANYEIDFNNPKHHYTLFDVRKMNSTEEYEEEFEDDDFYDFEDQFKDDDYEEDDEVYNGRIQGSFFRS